MKFLHSSTFYVIVIIVVIATALIAAKIIVSPSEEKGRTSLSVNKGVLATKENFPEPYPSFTIFSAPKVIPGAANISRRSMAAQDRQFWQNMDTLESTALGAMVEITLDGEISVALGDMIVSPGLGGVRRLNPGQRIPIPKPKLWPRGRIPHMIEATLPVREELRAALTELREQTGIEFVSSYKAKDFVVFRAHKEHCLSHVGRIGGEQEVLLGPNCKKGQILHELMHTLGFFHEQARPDRDEHMLIFWENIEPQFWEQFKKIPSDFQNLTDSEFDFNSIMLYPPEAFARDPHFATMAKLNGDLYTVNREEFSQLDIEKIIDIYKSELEN